MALSKSQITIKTKGPVAYEERNAAAAGIYPGMLVMVDSNGDFAVHDTIGQKCECMVALEDSLQGNAVSDVYVVSEPVRAQVFRPGEEFHGLLLGGQNIAIGELLISSGDGTFKSSSDSGANQNQAVAVALEAEDLSAPASTNTLVHMRAL